MGPELPAVHRVGWGFISLYTLAFLSTSLLFLAPAAGHVGVEGELAGGTERAPNSLALVGGSGHCVAIVGNPFFGRMSDRTSSPLGDAPAVDGVGLLGGSLGILVVALAPTIPVVLVGWCIAQLFFNALLAAQVAVLPDQVPRLSGAWSPVSWVSALPIASVAGTFLVKLFTGNLLAMFLVPCVVGGFFVLLFAVTLDDRRLDAADKPSWSLRELAARSTSARGLARISRGPSPAASCSCWRTPF